MMYSKCAMPKAWAKEMHEKMKKRPVEYNERWKGWYISLHGIATSYSCGYDTWIWKERFHAAIRWLVKMDVLFQSYRLKRGYYEVIDKKCRKRK